MASVSCSLPEFRIAIASNEYLKREEFLISRHKYNLQSDVFMSPGSFTKSRHFESASLGQVNFIVQNDLVATSVMISNVDNCVVVRSVIHQMLLQRLLQPTFIVLLYLGH